MFANSHLKSFTIDLPNLVNGYWMFNSCSDLSTFNSNAPRLVDGQEMFSGCSKLTSFESDLPSLKYGADMFCDCTALTSFTGALYSLEDGTNMFHGCKLDIASVERIAETVPFHDPTQTHLIHIGIVDATRKGANAARFMEAMKTLTEKGWTVEICINGNHYFSFEKDEFSTELPIGYTRLEYIESTGNQYIDTGIKGNPSSTKGEIVFAFDAQEVTNTKYALCGAKESSAYNPANYVGSTWLQTTSDTNTNVLIRSMNSDESTALVGVTNDINRKHVMTFWNKTVTLDGTSKTGSTKTNTTLTSNFMLFAVGVPDGIDATPCAKARIYSVKLWLNVNGLTLARYMIPALDKNGTPCMFDLVERKAYYKNEGATEEFKYGYVPTYSLLKGYKRVEYLERTTQGASYIVTDEVIGGFEQSFEMEVVAMPKSKNMSGGICGNYINGSTGYLSFWCSYGNTNLSCSAIGDTKGTTAYELNAKYRLNALIIKNQIKWSYTNEYTGKKDSFNGSYDDNAFNKLKSSLTHPIGIFSIPSWSGDNYYIGRIYEVIIKKDGVITAHFIPVVDEDGVGCMYDIINKKAYYSKTSTPFVVPPAYSAAVSGEVEFVEYIETHTEAIWGTSTRPTGYNNLAWFDTGIYPDLQETEVNLDFAIVEQSTPTDNSTQTPFGVREYEYYVASDFGISDTNLYSFLAWSYKSGTRLRIDAVGSSSYTVDANSSVSFKQKTSYYSKGNIVKINGVQYVGPKQKASGRLSFTFLLGGANTGRYNVNDNPPKSYQEYCPIRIYGCKFVENGEVIADFRPVQINGECYLLDIVSDRLIYKSGTGTVTYKSF